MGGLGEGAYKPRSYIYIYYICTTTAVLDFFQLPNIQLKHHVTCHVVAPASSIPPNRVHHALVFHGAQILPNHCTHRIGEKHGSQNLSAGFVHGFKNTKNTKKKKKKKQLGPKKKRVTFQVFRPISYC